MTAESHFLPGTKLQWAWDSTSLGYLKECPRKYYYTMIENWRSRHQSVHLTFGLHYHAALEQYDKMRSAGKSHEEAMREALLYTLTVTWDKITGRPWISDHDKKTRFTLVRSIIWYLDHFKDDPCKTVQLQNGKPAVELSFKMSIPLTAPNGLDYVLCGHLDRLAEFQASEWVLDRKTTTGTLSMHYFQQYSPDNQMSLYMLAGKTILQRPIKGVIIDAAQIAAGFTRFARDFVQRTQTQLEEFLDDTIIYIKRAEEYAERGYWPMNDKACNNYGGCQFRGVCSKSPEVRHAFLETDFHKEVWNPLEARGD